MFTRFLFLLIISLLISFTFSPFECHAEYICGDANSDGVLNISDAVFIINYVFSGGPYPDQNCCEEPLTVTDIDGNVYQTVTIGSQIWMAENLKVTHYRNGAAIINITDNSTWGNITYGSFCSYNNEDDSADTYGLLYNWYAVDDVQNIAPEGWHVPSEYEIQQLELYLGINEEDLEDVGWRGTDEGGTLKDTGTIYWANPNTGATNTNGFKAIPSGYRRSDGYFMHIGYFFGFWSTDPAIANSGWCRILENDESRIERSYYSRTAGLAIRCVKD